AAAPAVGDLLVREHAAQEPLIPPLHHLPHPGDQGQVHPDSLHFAHARPPAAAASTPSGRERSSGEGANEADGPCSPPAPQAAEKGPAARRRPKPGREAYGPYVERPGEGANEADGPRSPPAPQATEKGPAARRRPQPGREAYGPYVERPGEGAHEAAG